MMTAKPFNEFQLTRPSTVSELDWLMRVTEFPGINEEALSNPPT